MTVSVVIPGLAMAASEFTFAHDAGVRVLENPEIGASRIAMPGTAYTLEDVAELHAATIASWNLARTESLRIVGMSMGGMILSILATRFRKALPEKTSFCFLVTSANLPHRRAVPDGVLADWQTAKIGSARDFERILLPFFAPSFAQSHPDQVSAYARYRATGGNAQSPKSFFRQLNALRSFDGERYFGEIDPSSSSFVVGAEDKVLGPRHGEDLRRLSPKTQFVELSGLGHMVNLEAPELLEALCKGTIP